MHCGKVNDKSLSPRKESIDLEKVKKASEFSPITWEGCVVKISDKISYLGRDIEDAITQKILGKTEIDKLKRILKETIKSNLDAKEINNTVLMHKFIINLCNESSPEKGISFSKEFLELIKSIKSFNQEYIYDHKRLNYFKKYVELVLESIFNTLINLYKEKDTLEELENYKEIYPSLISTFQDWLIKYSDVDVKQKKRSNYENNLVYSIESKSDYIKAIIQYISGMTDNFALKVFQELTTF